MSSKKPKRAASGGSVTLARRGIKRAGGENGNGAPEQFCVIDGPNEGDLSETVIRRLYKGNALAQECITATLDLYRASDPAPDFFWKICREGNHTAVRYVDIGPGSDGVIRLLIVDGRHRKDAIVRVNVEREATGEIEPLPLFNLALKIPSDPTLAASIIRKLKTSSNVGVAMAPSHLAYRAFEWHAAGESDYAVGVRIGLRSETAERDVPKYLSLAQCIRPVQLAVDAGEVKLDDVAKWRNAKGDFTKTVEWQTEWLAARLTPKVRKPRAEVRPLPPRKVALLAHELRDLPALAPLLSLLLGTAQPKDIADPALRERALRALGDGS